MLTFFPTLYPDETLYSGWARYAERAGYRKPEIHGDLIGRYEYNIGPEFILETNIGSFANNFSNIPLLSKEHLINNHTLFPLYSFTLSHKEYLEIKEREFSTRRGSKIRKMSSNHKLDFARFCENCVTEDIERFGETYWHRVHQIPGIVICPYHSTVLKDSELITTRLSQLVTARKSISGSCKVTTNIENSTYLALQYKFSQNARFLLEHPGIGLFRENTNNRLCKLFYEHNFASPFSKICSKKLFGQLESRYPPEVLFHFGFSRLRHRSLWLRKLLKRGGRCYILEYFLFLDFLNIDFPSFFSQSEDYQPFGAGPWNCYNPTCPNYLKPVLTDYILKRSQGRNVGVFTCDCGFSYRLRHDVATHQANDTNIYVLHYGDVWVKKLRELLDTPGLSLVQMAKTLGICRPSLRRIKNLFQKSPLADISIRRDKNKHKTKRKHRKIWIAACRSGFSRSQLKSLHPTSYLWLMRYDRDWFEKNSPPRWQSSVQWEKIDADWAYVKIPDAIDKLYARSGKPIRITKASICRLLNKELTSFRSSKKRLPLTNEVLNSIRESSEHFVIRSIEYKCDRFIGSGKLISRKNFNYEVIRYGHLPEVMKKIYDTIERVNRALGEQA